MDSREKVTRFINNQKKVTPHAKTIDQLMQKIQDPRSNARQLGEIIKVDPIMSAKLLHLVNSPFYGLSGKISSISQAVVILGFNEIRNLAYQFMSYQLIDFKKSPFLQFVWDHSLYTGIIAQSLALKEHLDIPEEAFIAGLVHDIGKSVLYNLFGAQYMEVSDELEQEREELGIDHCIAGKILGKAWFFPEKLQKVIEHHHRDFSMINDKFTLIVSIANILSLGEDPQQFRSVFQDKLNFIVDPQAFVEDSQGKWQEELHRLKGVFNANL